MGRYELNARHLLCPLPVIRTQDLVNTLEADDTIIITCSDAGALNDIPAWCRINGHRVIATRQDKDEVVIEIQVSAHKKGA